MPERQHDKPIIVFTADGKMLTGRLVNFVGWQNPYDPQERRIHATIDYDNPKYNKPKVVVTAVDMIGPYHIYANKPSDYHLPIKNERSRTD